MRAGAVVRNGRARWGLRLLGASALSAAAVGTTLIGASSAGAAPSGSIWSGQDTAASWSAASNWSTVIPGDGADVDFPALGSDCQGSAPSLTCYTSVNDIANLSLHSITIDGSVTYYIGSSNTHDGVTLDAGGLTETGPTTPTYSDTNLALPITLGTGQTWSLTGSDLMTLQESGGITGDEPLAIDLSGGPTLEVRKGTTTGPQTITGADGSDTGTGAGANGIVALRGTGSLNGGTTEPVTLTDAELNGAGGTGPLTTDGAFVDVGDPGATPGAIAVHGGATFDPATAVGFTATQSGSTPGSDYSQLTATGPVDLGGADLDMNLGYTTNSGSTCFAPPLGQAYTLVSTTGSLSGTFSSGGSPVPGGGTVPLNVPAGCPASPDLMRVTYNTTSSPATVVGTIVGPTSTTISALPNPATEGNDVTYSATVAAAPGVGGTPTGTVAFSDGSTHLCTAALVGGTGSCTSSAAPAGNQTITGVYSGSTDYLTSSGTTGLVVLAATTTTVSALPNPATLAQEVTYSATVADVDAGGTPTGTVTFTIGSLTLCMATLSGGTGSCMATTAPLGSNTVLGTYSGDPANAPSSGMTTLQVNQGAVVDTTTTITALPSPVTFGNEVTYSATVTPASGSVQPDGTVAFTIGATNLCTATITDGTGSCMADNAPVGTDQTVTGQYSGQSGAFGPSSGTTTLTVNPAELTPTTTTPTATPPSSTFGDSVEFSVTVAPTEGSGTPTGTVAFSVGSTDLCTATLTDGAGSCDATNAPIGDDTVSAVYSGDTQFATSTGTTTLTVSPAPKIDTVTAVHVNPSTVHTGGTVTYSATVSPTSGSGTPTGTVTFTTGVITLCTATLSGGSGSCTANTAPKGDDLVVGAYAGDTNYNPSSGTTTLVVESGGYWLVASDGTIYPFGSAVSYGSMAGRHLNAPVVGMASTLTGHGYWLVGADGGIFNFGDAGYYGSAGNIHLNAPVVGMAATPDAKGYWLVAADGGVFNYGDAHFYGSAGNIHLNEPVVGMAATPDGRGYWLVAADGGIFNYGDAHYYGSTGNIRLNQKVVGLSPTPDGHGYSLVAGDGGTFNFGDARYWGSAVNIRLNKPMIGITLTPDGQGYWLVAADGGVFAYGDALYLGGTGGIVIPKPVTGDALD